MALIVGENSYITLEEGQTIIEKYATEDELLLWDSLGIYRQENAFEIATERIENEYYPDYLKICNQTLSFPLNWCVDIESKNMKRVKTAQALEGLYIAINKQSTELYLKGVKQHSDKLNSVTYNGSRTAEYQRCKWNNVKAYDYIKGFIQKGAFY